METSLHIQRLQLHPQAISSYPQLVQIRRKIHQKPQLGFDLPHTTQLVQTYLQKLGLQTYPNIGNSGIVAIKRGGPHTLLFRADMDALPITQSTDLPFKSLTSGAMHACGHDAHTSILLITAKLLSKMTLDFTIKFLFQPAQQILQGAKAMIEDGVMEDVDQVYTLHVYPKISIGQAIISSKYASASCYTIRIVIRSIRKSGYNLNLNSNPIVVGSYLMQTYNSVVQNAVSSSETVLLVFGCFMAGQQIHGIPVQAEIKGTIRAYSIQGSEKTIKRLEEINKGFQKSFGCQIFMESNRVCRSTVNWGQPVENARQAFRRISDGEIFDSALLIGEDVGEFMYIKQGCLMLLGTGCQGFTAGLHSEYFQLAEQVMVLGVSWFINLAMRNQEQAKNIQLNEV